MADKKTAGTEELFPTGPISAKLESMLALERFREERRRDFDSLSQRERDVLALVALGKANPEIANALGIARATVQNHRAVIRQKLAITAETEYFKFALAFELISL